MCGITIRQPRFYMQIGFISKTFANGNRFVINFLKECLEGRFKSNGKKLGHPKYIKKKQQINTTDLRRIIANTVFRQAFLLRKSQ